MRSMLPSFSILSLCLLTGAAASFVACGGDDDAPPGSVGSGGDAGASGAPGRAGAGGAAAGSGGRAGSDGKGGTAGSPTGQAGAGGSAGTTSGGSGTAGFGGAILVAGAGGASGAAVGGGGGATGGSPAGGAAGSGGQGQGGSGVVAKKPFDWVGVIGTGQSLSVGAVGTPVISTKQPYANLKLADSSADPKFPIDGSGTYATAPLIEPIRGKMGGYSTSEYPNNIAGETPHSGMGNQLSAFFQTRGLGEYVTAHSVVGWSGKPLVCIDKDESAASKCADTPVTTRGYLGSLAEAKAFTKLAKAANKTFGYGAIILTHGESDAGNQKYQAGIIQLQADYEKDLQAITGQTSRIPLLISQTSTKAGATSSAVQVWKAGVEADGKVICVGPKYAYEYAADALHFPAASYLRLGQKYAEVMDLVVNQGVAWQPLAPDRAAPPTVSGAVITVPFHVPNPPLQWDDSQPKNHQKENDEWSKGRGFEVRTSKGVALSIASVEIVGSAVKITLVKAPIAADGLVVGYAITQDGTGNQGGLATGLRGDLRDADDYLGYDTQTISAKLTKGSATVKSAQANGFATRAGRDLVTGKGIAAGTVVLATPDANTLTLSKPWTGESATVDLTLHHDQHNYAVHFSLPVPP